VEEPFSLTSRKRRFILADDSPVGFADDWALQDDDADLTAGCCDGDQQHVVRSVSSEVIAWHSPRIVVAPETPKTIASEPTEALVPTAVANYLVAAENSPVGDNRELSKLMQRILFFIAGGCAVTSAAGFGTFLGQSNATLTGSIGWVVGIAGAGLAIETFCGIIWLQARSRRREPERGQSNS